MEDREIKIPVPWGHVSAKTWGCRDNEIVLCVHGWLDNASAFDKLIPLLPQNFYYISIDLPSHGFSSPFQVSTFVHQVDFVLVLKLILRYLDRETYILLSHSTGAFVSILFAQMYPKYVSKLITLDAYHFYPTGGINYLSMYKHKIHIYERTLENKNQTFTFEDARNRMIKNRMTRISKEAAEILMRRAVEKTADGNYKFTAMKHMSYLMFMPFTVSYLLDMVKTHPIRCPHLLISCTESSHFKLCFKDIHKEYEKNRNFKFHEAKGTHDVHIEHPDRISDIISDFLIKSVSKL